jgi:ABC-type bacteriocin/lantibiotic exporter with double-glycine peptidase domain
VHAAYRRLARLNGGEATPAQDALLQAAVAKQEKRIRLETSVCGPKTIEYLLTRLGRPAKGYKDIAKLCGTTDAGTTIEGLRKGLRALGVDSYAYKLNRRDLEGAPMPAILLEGDHFVALLKIEGGQALVYDSRYRAEREIGLPGLDDPDFFAAAILFSEPELKS